MRAEEARGMNKHEDAAEQSDAVTSTHAATGQDASLGQRLCAAREARGWTRSDAATRLKLPSSLIARLECGDYSGLTQGVFLQGYLASYCRLVGLPIEQATTVAAANTSDAPLVATGTISRSRYLLDRYSVSATYLVLTAIIVVPAVWLATHGGLEQNLARTTALDPPPAVSAPLNEPAQAGSSSVAATTDAPGATAPAERAALTPVALPPEQGPVIASMAPFVSVPAPSPIPVEPALPAVASGSGSHTLTLKLTQPSWVEILTADGHKLEYGILAAGSEHHYRSDGPVSVRLGNAQGAQVISDQRVLDLAPFQRGNVAHVNLFGDNGASRVE